VVGFGEAIGAAVGGGCGADGGGFGCDPCGCEGGAEGPGGVAAVAGGGLGGCGGGEEFGEAQVDGGGVGPAVGGFLRQEPGDEAVEFGGHVGPLAPHRIGQLFEVRGLDLVRRAAVGEQPFARRHLVQERAEGVQVRGGPGRLGADLLGRHVVERARFVAGGGEPRGVEVEDGGDPEVDDMHEPCGPDDDVGGLEVAVDDLLGVGRFQHRGELGADREGPVRRERPGLVEEVAQVQAGEVRHGEEQLAGVLVESGVEDRGDAGVADLGGDARFAAEPRGGLVPLRAVEEVRFDQFDGDLAVESLVDGLPDASHAARADRADQLVPVRDDLETAHVLRMPGLRTGSVAAGLLRSSF
jgi:hypothetical protein